MDQESLVILLLRERVKLLAYLTSIVRDDHLAEDVYQEVAALAMRKSEKIRDRGHFLAWMRVAGRHRALKVLQQRRRCQFMDESLLDQLDEQWAEHDLESASDLADALRHCMGELSPYARTLIKLRYTEGISGLRLAEAVDRNLNTVYVALSRIHRTLGDCVRRRLGSLEGRQS